MKNQAQTFGFFYVSDQLMQCKNISINNILYLEHILFTSELKYFNFSKATIFPYIFHSGKSRLCSVVFCLEIHDNHEFCARV